MAWIESHQELLNHPKTLDLISLMRWSNDTSIAEAPQVLVVVHEVTPRTATSGDTMHRPRCRSGHFPSRGGRSS